MDILNVNIERNNSTYPIFLENNSIESMFDDISKVINKRNFIMVISSKVYKLYSKYINFPKDKIFILKDGEKEKNFKNYQKIMNFALKHKLTRNDFIIAVGGGVVGDISGFVASTYMRGIKLIQVPTTLLAATDSSVGGKTAINTSFGKNLVGAFYQPEAVFINVNFLNTLDSAQYKSGLGEVIKYSLIEGNCLPNEKCCLIHFLMDNLEKISQKDSLTLMILIRKCLEIKIMVVSADEKESGLRRILNYGHTYGHAVEKITNYRKYTHGQCVVEGIRFVLNLGLRLNLIDKDYKFLCEDLIDKFQYPPLKKYNIDKVIEIIKMDKKALDNSTLTLIMPTSYAQVGEFHITPEKLREVLEY